ncbi:hypothetical protein KIN20_014235 [Parelaphostrongylus tenuis]|uniref:Uncharacterized protein n=1 Tax=Parelaphostrongylus tenuis TaxID=148309 RepID=A0AAD5QLI3_PARTN|nr:hypothetical protein KIN20_014235 [Parelaphostrongylus tenuis]
MAKVPASSFVMPLFIITAVLGCGTLPSGPASMSSRTFNVSGFSLPVAMAFTSAPGAVAQVANISTSADVARGFVMRTIMQAVFDVLEHQGRAAGLPDFIIMSILNQLNVSINYTPLECKDVAVNHAMPAQADYDCGHDEAKMHNLWQYSDCSMQYGLYAEQWNACTVDSQRTFVNFRNSHDHKHHYGKLVKRYVARRSEQSGSSFGSSLQCDSTLNSLRPLAA